VTTLREGVYLLAPKVQESGHPWSKITGLRSGFRHVEGQATYVDPVLDDLKVSHWRTIAMIARYGVRIFLKRRAAMYRPISAMKSK